MQVNGNSAGTKIIWYYQGRESTGGVIPKPPHAVVLGDVKKLYLGPPCHFLLKTPEGRPVGGHTKFHWTLIIDDASPVPWIEIDTPVIVAKLRVIEKPFTTITYCIEGRNDSQIVKIPKPVSQVTFLEVKDNFPGSHGIFLFKTMDATGFYWSILLDNFAAVPSLDGEVVVQIKMKNTAKTVIEITEESGLNPLGLASPAAYIRLDKPATTVTLQDIRPFYGGQPGIFLFKTPDNSMGDQYCWTVFANEHSPVPLFSEDTIICKVKPVKRVNLTPPV